jgi:hypothetical protein
MASQIKHPRAGQPNFRPPLRDRVKPRVSAQERREGNCEKHLALIRQLPCCVTGRAGPNDPHHLLGGPAGKERAFGRRATDQWAVPICRYEHEIAQRLHGKGELGFFRERGVADPYELAAALWKAPRDVEIMTKIVQSHMGRPRRTGA